MNEFNKFKKKILTELIIKCFSIGFSLGLIVFSIPLIFIKLKRMEFNIWYLVLIAVGVFLVVSGILFLIAKPTNKNIAKRIDQQLNLNEKVQTMVEFEKEDNFMVNIQRENTLSILSKIDVKSLTMKFSLILIMVVFISFSLCITAIAIPNYEEPPIVEPIDPDYVVDNWTIMAIKALIEDVEDSSTIQSLKEKYISYLNDLIKQLEENVDKESQMKESVLSLIAKVYLELDKVNTNNEVFTVLKDSPNSLVSSLAVEINLLDYVDVNTQLDGIIILISGQDTAIQEFKNDFGDLLTQSKLDKTDDLYKALIKLSEDIYNCRNESDINNAVINVVNTQSDIITDIIKQQAENKRVADHIDKELRNIFSLYEDVEDEDPKEDETGDKTDGSEDENKEPGQDQQGGLGPGGIQFGSDDMFFDPEQGSVKYGDVITKYYGDIIGKLNDGTIPEELREIFNYYYELLFGDLESEE